MRRLHHRLCLLGLLLLLALASVQTAGAQTGNPQHDAMAARPQAEQREALHALIRATGSACTSVIIIYYAGQDSGRTAYWDGRCQDGALYRAAFAPPRWSQPSLVTCGALVASPAGGPCFRPVQQAEATPAAFASADEPRCRASCASQPSGLVNNCVARCLAGVGAEVGTQAVAQLPANSRFGVVFATDQPLGAWGFGNGSTDRLGVNVQAARACQQMAGRTPCKFLGEIVNSCGALAQRITRHPSAIAITSSMTTYLVNYWAVGTGASAAAAEAAAMADCRRSENPTSQCRVVISGC